MPRLFRRVRRRPKRVLTAVEEVAKKSAQTVLLKRVAELEDFTGIYANRVAIRDQRSRWGSASSLGNLNLNWRIAQMPAPVRDYVIIHELAHLREMNHSKAFWAIVEEFCPSYREHRRWLREYSRQQHVIMN